MLPSRLVAWLVERVSARSVPTEDPTTRDYRVRLHQAAAKGWRLDEAEARTLTELSVQHGHIEPEKAPKLAYKLQHGEVMLSTAGWVCSFCGGNCGQCGMTDFIGNVPFSFDRVVQSAMKGGA